MTDELTKQREQWRFDLQWITTLCLTIVLVTGIMAVCTMYKANHAAVTLQENAGDIQRAERERQ